MYSTAISILIVEKKRAELSLAEAELAAKRVEADPEYEYHAKTLKSRGPLLLKLIAELESSIHLLKTYYDNQTPKHTTDSGMYINKEPQGEIGTHEDY